jgi:hypothetical protein
MCKGILAPELAPNSQILELHEFCFPLEIYQRGCSAMLLSSPPGPSNSLFQLLGVLAPDGLQLSPLQDLLSTMALLFSVASVQWLVKRGEKAPTSLVLMGQL